MSQRADSMLHAAVNKASNNKQQNAQDKSAQFTIFISLSISVYLYYSFGIQNILQEPINKSHPSKEDQCETTNQQNLLHPFIIHHG
eukprot:14502492-Ditylum_brightwellii.AAC.1